VTGAGTGTGTGTGATYRIGIDVGGTFTDLFVWEEGGTAETFKVLSTPEDPSIGVLEGLAVVAAAKGLALAELAARTSSIVHGTTVTTNAVLTRGGARTGLITTRGVRDALEMRRGIRERQYDNRYRNVEPLVPRRRRHAVTGRLDYAGSEVEALSREEVSAAAAELVRAGCDAIAICFMNAFANPEHEEQAAELVRAAAPDVALSVSSHVLPTVRFYNRVSTTVLNAYVSPVLGEYLDRLTTRLAETEFRGVLLIMQSNGGVAAPDVTAARAAGTLLSGPAAGPEAAVVYTAEHDRRDAILVDMGGTSFDASLVQDGAAALEAAGEIDRLRIALPMLSIVTIGAGGGSIGWVDEGGLLRMGPQSAGALPGPACYGRGGKLPTCTDADLVLGYLDPAYFAGGKLPLSVEKARVAIETHIAAPLGLSIEDAAAGMYRVININMAHGVREITTRRGLDPREFPLVIAGGAGSLHACMIARDLGMTTLLVPRTASTLCAAGMLMSDLQHDFVRSFVTRLADADWGRLRQIVSAMVAEGTGQLSHEGLSGEHVEHGIALDLRYVKQYHEVTVPVASALLESQDLEAIASAFHVLHNRLYGYDLKDDGTPLELINVRVRSVGRVQKPELSRLPEGGADASHTIKGERRVFVPERESFETVPVVDGHQLVAGNTVPGPALIERTDTTIFVSAGFSARVDALGSCLIEAASGEA